MVPDIASLLRRSNRDLAARQGHRKPSAPPIKCFAFWRAACWLVHRHGTNSRAKRDAIGCSDIIQPYNAGASEFYK
jgi:hypothetical protein